MNGVRLAVMLAWALAGALLIMAGSCGPDDGAETCPDAGERSDASGLPVGRECRADGGIAP